MNIPAILTSHAGRIYRLENMLGGDARNGGSSVFMRGLHIREYGARGDGKFLYDVVTNTSDKTITSVTGFTGVKVGMTVKIRKGGVEGRTLWTKVAGINTINSITLQDQPAAALTTGYVDYGTDDTEDFRRCMRDALEYGLNIYLDPVIYIIAGDEVTDDGISANPAAVLPLWPKNVRDSQGNITAMSQALARRSLTIICDQPHHCQQIWLLIDVPPVKQSGAWLVTRGTGSTSGGIVPAIFGTSANGNFLQFNLKNVGMAQDPNPTGQGVVMSGIRGDELSSVCADGVVVCADTSTAELIEPTSTNALNVVGISTAGPMRDQMSYLKDSQTWGMPVGMRGREHVEVYGNNFVASALIGFDAAASTQAWRASKINGHWNKVHFNVSGAGYFNVSMLNLEEKQPAEYNNKPWLALQYHINDANSLGHGTIDRAIVSYSTVVNNQTDVRIHGANNLKIYDIYGNLITARS